MQTLKEDLNINILVLDDEASIVSTLLQYLHKRGYDIVGTTNPDLAESIILTGCVDFLLLDINLGCTTGIELYRRVKEKGFKGKVLFITAYDIGDYQEELNAIGVNHVIQKPFQLYTVVEMIQKIASKEVKQG